MPAPDRISGVASLSKPVWDVAMAAIQARPAACSSNPAVRKGRLP
jgi:hypothetical protein